MGQFTKEDTVQVPTGWTMLVITIGAYLLAIAMIIYTIVIAITTEQVQVVALVAGVIVLISAVFMSSGFFTLQPNEASVITLFGNYVGTVRTDGFHWTNPFRTRKKVSLRSRNFNSPTLKVNDLRGNPIEIGAVVVWKVEDSAQAVFNVDNYRAFVEVQTESAVRQLASAYSYDDGEEGELTLRSGREEVAKSLASRLQDRLQKAGVLIEEARISHLAYAPEIAQAMLRRQQAEAIIAARTKIVEGAVSMVDMALHELSAKNVVELDEERKATMVSNLLVVLCSESDAQPVLNTGTLYN